MKKEEEKKDGEDNEEKKEGEEIEEGKPVSRREQLKESNPNMSRVVEAGIYAWQLTFPNDRYKQKFMENKERARVIKEEEEARKKYSEEEIEAMAESIPEWKKGGLTVKEEAATKESIREKLRRKVSD